MDISSVLEICKAYNKLGWAMQDQLNDIAESGGELENLIEEGKLNPNALYYINEFLQKVEDNIPYNESGYSEIGFIRVRIQEFLEKNK